MKPVATGSVVIALPMVDVEEEFSRGLGADEQTVIERTGDAEFRAVTRSGPVRIVQEFSLAPAGDEATSVEAAIWLRPAWIGWLTRRVMGRRRLQAGVDRALTGMARAATGEPEFGPEDFLDDEDDQDAAR
jgi:hypothetical protein